MIIAKLNNKVMNYRKTKSKKIINNYNIEIISNLKASINKVHDLCIIKSMKEEECIDAWIELEKNIDDFLEDRKNNNETQQKQVVDVEAWDVIH